MSKQQITLAEMMATQEYRGEIEIIIKDRNGKVVQTIQEPNIVKIFAKECLSHRLPFSKVWDPEGGSGSGVWVDSGIDPDETFAAKYILLGASFDQNGIPLDFEDPRYYYKDPVTETYKPIRLEPGAWYDGELINAIPIAEPARPLKRIETVRYEPTYQPAGSPLLQEDVRALNNILVLESTLRTDEYNGFGLTESDYFTITEVALAAGKTIDHVTTCDCKPRELFLDGPYLAMLSGGDVVTLDASVDPTVVRMGDQIKITGEGSDEGLDQLNPYYLVMSKIASGRDIQLDRVPTNSSGTPLTGPVNVWRDTLRIFSHRILSAPVKKSLIYEITLRWRIVFN